MTDLVELSDSVFDAVKRLNHALSLAGSNGLTVELDIIDVTTLGDKAKGLALSAKISEINTKYFFPSQKLRAE